MTAKHNSMQAKMQADYDAIAQAFAESRSGMHWAELDEMISRVPKDSKVLDIGCGTGRLCRQLQGVEYTGTEISEGQIKKAREYCPEGNFLQAEMTDLPFEDNSFDAVFMVASLHHLLKADQKKALKEAVRVLKTGGILNITVKAFWQFRYLNLFLNKKEGLNTLGEDLKKEIEWSDIFWPWKWKTETTVFRFYHAFRKGELKALLRDLPLKIIELNYYKNGQVIPFYKAKNLVLTAQKVVK